MKKIFLIVVLGLCFVTQASAESLVVIDGNGYVTKQMFTIPTTYNPAPVVTQQVVPATTVTTTTTTSPAVAPTMVVVRESPVVQNSYYYDRDTTNAAIAAGVTTAVVGGLIYNGFRHHRPRWHNPHHGRHHRRW